MSKKVNMVTGVDETFTLNLEVKDSNNAPVDLTGHAATLYVFSTEGTQIDTENAAVDEAGNISITSNNPATWPIGKHYYRVVHTDSVGTKKWLVYGTLTVMSGLNV